MRKVCDDLPLLSLTPFIGDLGAAAQLATLAYFHRALSTEGRPRRTVISTASSVGTLRSAIVVQKEQA